MPKTNSKERDIRSVNAVERAADVLDIIYMRWEPISVKEVSTVSGLSISTSHRLLTALGKKGLVDQHPETKRYTIGPKMVEYGLRYLRQLKLPSVAYPHMHKLRDLTRETVSISLVEGSRRFYAAQVESPQEIRQTLTLGHSLPLHLGGSGKAILAFLPERDRELYLSQPDLVPGVAGPVDLNRLRADLAESQRCGYAKSFGERLSGVASVSAPIRNHLDAVVGCISIGGPEWRFTEHRGAEFGRLVVAAAAEISRDLGARE